LSCSSEFIGDGIQREKLSPVDTEAFRDLLVIFLFAEGLCEVWLGQLSPCILCVCVGICTRLYMVSLHRNIYGAYWCSKKS
jgi:hypothetical protein